jgi:hypothetical protein
MALKRINSSDQDLQLVQDNVDSALTPLQAAPMNGGVVLDNISLITAQDNNVQHTLGRVPKIFFFGNLNANAVVWYSALTSSVITLQCSANCSITLWIN